MALNIEMIPKDVLENIKDQMGFEEVDESQKAMILKKIEKMSPIDAFDRYLRWHGIIGCTQQIVDVMRSLAKSKKKLS